MQAADPPLVRCPRRVARLPCSACSIGRAGDDTFWPASDLNSFTKLAAHCTFLDRMENRTNGIDRDAAQEALAQGIVQCPIPGCGVWFAAVGTTPPVCDHIHERIRAGDAAHIIYAAGQPGTVVADFAASLQRRIAHLPTSPAAYYISIIRFPGAPALSLEERARRLEEQRDALAWQRACLAREQAPPRPAPQAGGNGASTERPVPSSHRSFVLPAALAAMAPAPSAAATARAALQRFRTLPIIDLHIPPPIPPSAFPGMAGVGPPQQFRAVEAWEGPWSPSPAPALAATGGNAPMHAGGNAPLRAGAPVRVRKIVPLERTSIDVGGNAPLNGGGFAPLHAGGNAPMMHAGGNAPLSVGGSGQQLTGGNAPLNGGGYAPMRAGGNVAVHAGTSESPSSWYMGRNGPPPAEAAEGHASWYAAGNALRPARGTEGHSARSSAHARAVAQPAQLNRGVEERPHSRFGLLPPTGHGAMPLAPNGALNPAGGAPHPTVRPTGTGARQPAGHGALPPTHTGLPRPLSRGPGHLARNGALPHAGRGTANPTRNGAQNPAGHGALPNARNGAPHLARDHVRPSARSGALHFSSNGGLPPARNGNGATAHPIDDDFCVEVPRPPSPHDPSRVGSADADAELNRDGIAFIGSRGKRPRPQALPHSRPDCPVKPFVIPPVGAKRAVGGNGERCALCWCYVCDVVAADCRQWDSRDNNWPAHCNAHGGEPLWKKMREERRR